MYEILEERRKSMLNTMLVGIIVAVLLALSRDIYDYLRCREIGCFTNAFMFPVNIVVLFFSGLLITLKTRFPSWVLALLWQIFVLVVVVFTDTPEQLIAGKSSLAWVLVILPAAFIAHPNASFITAGGVTSTVLWLAKQAYGQVWPGINLYFIAMLWLIAFLAWIASRNLISAIEIAHAEQKRAHTEQERLNAILENVADGIVVLDPNGDVLRANPVALNMLGGEIERLVRPENKSELTVPDGRTISLSWAKVPEIGNVAVVRDVTRQIEIVRMKDAMLAVVSHELRTPVAGIIGAAEMLMAGREQEGFLQAGDAILEKGVDMIYRNAKRLLRLVDDLLDRAQVEAGKFSLVEKPFKATQLFQELKELVEQHKASDALEWALMVDSTVEHALLGDLGRLSQIARNLIDNAAKFTSAGSVRVLAFIKEVGGNAELNLVVQDTGSGIPPHQLPDIWQPFRRASDYAVRNTQGAGLGLSIVHSLVLLMDGSADVDSKVGKGTRFSISLPLEIVYEK